MTKNTDAPNYYAPDAADDYYASPDSLILDSYLKHKNDPKSMLKLKTFKMPVTDADASTNDDPPPPQAQ